MSETSHSRKIIYTEIQQFITCHMKKHNFLAFFPDLGSASDWLKQISQAARPIRNTTQIWVVTRHQYGISALVSQTSFGGKTSGGVAKCPQTNYLGCSQLSVVKPDTLLSFQFNNTPKKTLVFMVF